MASSRDDFIIAIRSAFLKKSTQQKFSLLTLVLISAFIILLSSLDLKVIRYLKIGINEIVEKKIRIKYLRSYFLLKGVGRVTIDRNIEFFLPSLNFHHSKKTNEIVLEVKIQNDKFDKNDIEKIINFREIRYSKYCNGINRLY